MDVRRRKLMLPKKTIVVDPEGPSGAYEVNLNDQWQKSTRVLCPDSSKYDGVYESFSNYNVHNDYALMTVTIHNLDEFTLYVRSYAESNYDFVMVSQLDVEINGSTSYQYSDAVKANTRTSKSGTDIYSYTQVKYENIGGGDHTIYIVYKKDGSGNSYDDRGYLIVDKSFKVYTGEPEPDPDVPTDPDNPDEPEVPETPSGINIANYMTVEALEDGLQLMLNANTIEYCIDANGEWVTLPAGSYSTAINAGQYISVKATNPTIGTTTGIGTFTITKACNLLGNCNSLLFGDSAATNMSISDYPYAFYRLFNGCTAIRTVMGGFLPAMALSAYCYYAMFYGCTNLISGPDLPAYACESYCYYNMFYGCTSLTTAGFIAAYTLATSCCYCMFYNCSSLTQVQTALNATTVAYMSCYYMYSGCTSLERAPDLPALTLAGYCYSYMFNKCTSLKYIKMLATDVSAGSCMSYWMYNVPAGGTFVKNAVATWDKSGVSGVPSGWTIEYE